MNTRKINKLMPRSIVLAVVGLIFPILGFAGDEADKMEDALSAAWPGMAEGATIMDWDGTVLKEGANGYTCLPTPPMPWTRACSRGSSCPSDPSPR